MIDSSTPQKMARDGIERVADRSALCLLCGLVSFAQIRMRGIWLDSCRRV